MTKHNKQIIKSVDRECLIRQIGAMNAGQCIQLERQTFFDAFPVFQTVFGPWHKYSGFYNSIIGSATTYRVSDSLEIGHIFIERVNAPEGRRFYVDQDREYLFDKQPDGTYKRNSIPYLRNKS